MSQCSDYDKVYVSKCSFIVALCLFEFFVGEMDVGQVCFLKEKKDLTAVVLNWLTEFHREISEQAKHSTVGHVDSYF